MAMAVQETTAMAGTNAFTYTYLLAHTCGVFASSGNMCC